MKTTSLVAAFVCGASMIASAQNGPAVAQGGVINGASFDKTQGVAPGSLVSIFGTNLASSTVPASTVPLSNSLGGVNVTFNNVAAPLLLVTSGQINAQLPFELAGSSTAQVVVNNNGQASAPQNVQLATAAPGVFAFFQFTPAPPYQTVAYGNADGAIAAPTSLVVPGFTTRPAKINDPQTLVILATGLGPVNPPVITGHDANDGQLHRTTTTPLVTVGNVQAQVVFAGMSPLYPGVYQLNIVIQPGTPTGNSVPLQISMNGVTSSDQFTIAVGN